MTDKEYYSDITMISNTMLGWLSVGPKYYQRQLVLAGLEREDEASYFIFGNAVHCKLLEPKEFKSKYFIRRHDTPSNAVQKKFFSILITHNRSDKKALIMAYKMAYSVAKMTDDAILVKANNLYSVYKGYIRETQENTNKIELTKAESVRIQAIENNIKLHKRANELLSISKKKNIITETEKVIIFDYSDIKMKGKLDRIIIDLDNNTVTLIDIKTHSTKREDVNFVNSFSKSFNLFNYDRQLYIYTMALYNYILHNYPLHINKMTFSHKIIAIKSNFDNEVKVFNISERWIESGETKFNKLIEQYKYYEKNGYQYQYGTNEFYEEEIIYD